MHNLRSLLLRTGTICLVVALLCPAVAEDNVGTAGEALYARYAETFDKDAAWNDLLAQVAFGARHPETPGAEAWRTWATDELKRLELDVWEQPFEARCGLTQQMLKGANVVAVYRPEAPRFIQLSAHWDSRRYADFDKDEAKRQDPVPAANDGASGVAVLMEVARTIAAVGLPDDAEFGVVFAFYDFEDQGSPRNADEFALGSAFYAENLPTTMTLQAAVNLDMVGDRDQLFAIERFSFARFPDLVDTYWSHGAKRFPDRFTRRRSGFILDDHIHLLRKGIPSIAVIDFDYPPWHTTGDLPDACSAESLRVAGLVSLSFIAYSGQAVSP